MWFIIGIFQVGKIAALLSEDYFNTLLKIQLESITNVWETVFIEFFRKIELHARGMVIGTFYFPSEYSYNDKSHWNLADPFVHINDSTQVVVSFCFIIYNLITLMPALRMN